MEAKLSEIEVEGAGAAEPEVALPDQHDFYKMPAKFGHVPVAEEPLGWDRKRRFEALYPRVELPFQVVERVECGSPKLEPNRLFFGDNLHIMRSLPNESIDLIYIDPPFFSQRNYNVLFGDQNELRSFKDIWDGGLNGYLVWLNARLYEMKRLLTPTGSIFVHLDWHASHYVKVELDKLFGYANFRNELIWCYSGGGVPRRDFPRKHDVILRYTRSGEYGFNVERKDYKENTQQVGIHSTYGRDSGKDVTIDLSRGTPVTDWWTDIPTVTGWNPEKIGYPTQKPEALLSRIIHAETDPGEVVADFFSGGGTTATVAQKLGRRWIACDISRVAVSITADRVGKVIEGQRAEADAKGIEVSIPDVEIAHWGIYEVENLSKMDDDAFRGFVLSAYEARVESTGSLVHGYKGKEPIHVGPPDPESPIRKEEIAEFANEVLKRRGSGGAGTVIAWAFTDAARQMAERIEAQAKVKLQFVKLRLVPIESPEFAAHVTEKHERYEDLLSFVLPPSIRLRRKKLGPRKYEFDASESVALNSGAKIINAQWDFDYRDFFTSSAGYELQRTKKGEPVLAAEYEFPSAGTYEIAVRVQDDLGGEAVKRDTIEVG
jgi:DNA modification methylase